MHNDFAMLVVLTGDKRSALAQYLVTTAETEQFGKCIVIPPPTKLTSSQRHQSNTIAEAPAVVGVPFPTLSWLEKRVDELNFAAIQRVAPELPFPNGHSELLDCERYLLMEQYFQTCIGHVASKDVITLIPLHDSQAAPKNRWTIIGNGATSNLDELRAYFGEPVAFYFAWMEHYNQWLLIPSGFGLLTLGWDWVYGTNADTNPLIPVFSIFIVIWAVLFVSVWERRQNILACRFHSFGLSANDSSAAAFTPATLADLKEAVSLRDGYRGTSRKNSFTGEYEIHYSLKKRFLWQCFSFAVTSVMLVIALTAQVCSLNLQGYMRGQDPLLEIDAISVYADPGSLFDPEGYLFVVPITIHACSILVLNLVYRRISMWLTALENYPTETEHEHAMIVKRVCFEFVDCFAALFYVAFYRRDIVQLRQELVSLYTFDQIRRVALETVMPFVTQRASHWWHHRSSRTEGSATLDDGVGASPSPSSSAKLHDDRATFTRAMDEIEKEEYESFDDYMEMTMQYGYVTLFASAFPLAAVCSVIGNLLEINSDFVKLRYVLRRPLPRREVSIGPWVQVLRLFTYISVITNVSVFAYTSNQMRTAFPRYFNALGEMRDGTEEYVVVALFVLEHLLLAAVFFIDWWIPRIPYSVKSLMRQRQKRIAQISADAQESNDVKRPRHTSKKHV